MSILNYPNNTIYSKEINNKFAFDYFDEVCKIIDNMTDEEFYELLIKSGLKEDDNNIIKSKD